jgi:hypothetical protein
MGGLAKLVVCATKFLGKRFCAETPPLGSHSKFNQPVRGFRQNREFWQFSTYHCDLVAGMKSGANVTIFVDLIRKIFALRDRETHAREEFGRTREQARTSYSVFLRLRQQCLHQMSAATLFLLRRRDGDGANFRQVRTIEVEGAASDDHTAVV